MNKNEQILKLLLLMAFADKKYMEEEKDLVLKEANEIPDVEDIVVSIILVDNLRIQKN